MFLSILSILNILSVLNILSILSVLSTRSKESSSQPGILVLRDDLTAEFEKKIREAASMLGWSNGPMGYKS